MRNILILTTFFVLLSSVGCANRPMENYYVTEIKSAGSGIMLKKCRILHSVDCMTEFVEVTGMASTSPPIQLNNNVK